MIKQRNNHARSKKKRALLKLKNRSLRMFINQLKKRVSRKETGLPMRFVELVNRDNNIRAFEYERATAGGIKHNIPNQRQKRKLAAQNR